MLDLRKKKLIDDLRDNLLNKVPSPEAQVEQITIGLMYKFMFDMDQESIEMGGVPSFFIGEFEKYSWDKLFDPRLSGPDKVKLYSEVIENMNTNPHIPQLFRDIFKNSYLPFKDPSTLSLFINDINQFDYSDSETLGDAYEYLLSFMGTQGKLGQFRTPRHIIDFIVEIINPQKNESILDPACGTSGFLISSFKHILKQNTNKTLGDKLNSDDRKKISGNLVGYDIEPNMVKISLVNMYLNEFSNPLIHEYDALSSEDRWNEYFDLILANPPFMTPKGGIKPHSKFGLKSKRAEVLFVDYIIEHLKPTGRAGIIVPEGVIFKNNDEAYIMLRKKLVEDCLVGVISLPAGVFRPYSGVKTSILILDKELNQKSDSIFFAKVENDGFSLGAQRTPIAKNDLPSVISKFNEFLLGNFMLEECIEKESILDTSDYSFSADKYLSNNTILNSDYPIKTLKDICEITMGQSPNSEFYNENGDGLEFHQGKTNFGNIHLKPSGVWASQYNKVAEENSILMSVRAPVGPVNITDRKIALGRGLCGIKSNSDCDQMYLFYLLQSSKEKLTQSSHGSTFDSINRNQLLDFEIPLPPIEVQQQIVDELEGYQKIIDGCRQVVENYKPTIDIDPSWEMVELGVICSLKTGGTPKSTKKEYYENGTIPWLVSGDIHTQEIFDCDGRITQEGLDSCNAKLLPIDSVMIALNGQGKTRGTVSILRFVASCNQSLVSILPNDKETLLVEYLFVCLNGMYKEIRNLTGDNQRSGLNMQIIRGIKIPIAPISIQKEIVKKIEEERKIMEGNKKLIDIYTQKIQDRISKVWGE